jgi:hypothetical protein
MLIFHSKVWVLIGGLNGSNMPHGLDRLCPTMLPCCIWQAWTLPEGQEAKWIGEKTADGRTYYWSRKSCSGKTLCAENGLGIPQFQTALGGLVLECTRYIWSQLGIPRCDDVFFLRKSVRVLKEWVSLTVKIWYMNILDINHGEIDSWNHLVLTMVFHDIRHNLTWASAIHGICDFQIHSNPIASQNADIENCSCKSQPFTLLLLQVNLYAII